MELDHLLGFFNRRVIGAAEIVRLRHNVMKERTDRIKVQRAMSLGQGLGIVTLDDKKVAIPLVGSGIIGGQFNGAAQFSLGRAQIPVVTHGYVAQDSVWFSELGIELQGTLRGFLRFWLGFAGRQPVVGYLAENGRRRSETSISFRVIWIVVYGLFEKSDAAAQVTAAAPGKFTLKEGVTGVGNLRCSGVHSSGLQRRRRLRRQRKRSENLPGNGCRHV